MLYFILCITSFPLRQMYPQEEWEWRMRNIPWKAWIEREREKERHSVPNGKNTETQHTECWSKPIILFLSAKCLRTLRQLLCIFYAASYTQVCAATVKQLWKLNKDGRQNSPYGFWLFWNVSCSAHYDLDSRILVRNKHCKHYLISVVVTISTVNIVIEVTNFLTNCIM